MRRVRDIKKSQNLMRSVQSQSREIISSIYASTDAEQLQFKQNQDLWNICPQKFKNTIQQSSTLNNQPLKDLLPLIKHLASQPHFDICSYLLLSYNNLHAVTQESRITIARDKKDKTRLRYWLSHIYFHRLRNQLTESLVHSEDHEQRRDIIHINEEKQYMPMAFSAKKKTSALVRQFKVSSEAMYSKQGKAERQPFCIGYFLNGAEQLFSFTEVLSFIEYPFNLQEVSYFKILPVEKDGSQKYRASFSKTEESYQERERIDRFKKIFRREERWMYHKEQIDELKRSMIFNRQFQAYSMISLLEMVAFLEINEFIDVKELKIEWIIDQLGNCRLSNCFNYLFAPINTNTSTQGLVSLYQKKLLEQSSDQSEINKAFRVKKMKSKDKSMGKSTIVPPLKFHSLSSNSQMNNSTISSFRRKTRSAINWKVMKKWVI